MLPVAVHLSGDVIALAERVLEAGLHGSADPEVERVADDRRALGSRIGGGAVGGAVVDHENVEVGRGAEDVADDASDHPLLVVGGDDRQLA